MTRRLENFKIWYLIWLCWANLTIRTWNCGLRVLIEISERYLILSLCKVVIISAHFGEIFWKFQIFQDLKEPCLKEISNKSTFGRQIISVLCLTIENIDEFQQILCKFDLNVLMKKHFFSLSHFATLSSRDCWTSPDVLLLFDYQRSVTWTDI